MHAGRPHRDGQNRPPHRILLALEDSRDRPFRGYPGRNGRRDRACRSGGHGHAASDRSSNHSHLVCLFPAVAEETAGRRTVSGRSRNDFRFWCLGFRRRRRETTATATTHLATLAAGRTRFIGRPFVGCSLFMRRATTLAGDLALFLGRHRGEPSPFLTVGIHVHGHTPKSKDFSDTRDRSSKSVPRLNLEPRCNLQIRKG